MIETLWFALLVALVLPLAWLAVSRPYKAPTVPDPKGPILPPPGEHNALLGRPLALQRADVLTRLAR